MIAQCKNGSQKVGGNILSLLQFSKDRRYINYIASPSALYPTDSDEILWDTYYDTVLTSVQTFG